MQQNVLFRKELCQIILNGIPPNISTSSQNIVERNENTASTSSIDSPQELIRAIAVSTVTILNDKLARTDPRQTSHEQLIGARTSLHQILSSEDSISCSSSSFILDVFNENRDTTTLLGVAGVVGCLYFKIQVHVDENPDSNKNTFIDSDFVAFIGDCESALNDFYRKISPEDLPEDLQIYHLKIRNIAKLLAWWLKNPYPVGNEFYPFNLTLFVYTRL